MTVQVLNEVGYDEALYGLGLSYGVTSGMDFEDFHDGNPKHTRMVLVGNRLASNDTGENKFLEAIQVWLLVRAPRFWFQEFDTYRVAVTKQSESTMHTLMSRPLTEDDFYMRDVGVDTLEHLNELINDYNFYSDKTVKKDLLHIIKSRLPEGLMQRRLVCTNYKVLRHIYAQRKNHRIRIWHDFFNELEEQLSYWHLITAGGENG